MPTRVSQASSGSKPLAARLPPPGASGCSYAPALVRGFDLFRKGIFERMVLRIPALPPPRLPPPLPPLVALRSENGLERRPKKGRAGGGRLARFAR